MIRFPLLKHIRVSDYQLYPGPAGSGGIDRALPSGVTVIAGVNGLGKTTLLNMIFRVLSGPCDWRVVGEDDIGNIKHELVRWRHPSYFRDRVRNGAAGAVVTAEVGFGVTTINVSRSLEDFSVQSLLIDGSALEPSEERYQSSVRAASGVDSDAQGIFIINSLVRLAARKVSKRSSASTACTMAL